jgi:hypothetical protein
MDGQIMYPLYRDNLFAKAKRLADYEKMKSLHRSITEMIEKTEPMVKSERPPRNPRQDIMQRQDKNNLRVLLRQKQRLEERMKDLEWAIRADIDATIPIQTNKL